MNNYSTNVEEILQKNGVKIIKNGNQEISVKCFFNNCDDKKSTARLCFSKEDGTYYCHKCGVKGNLITLQKHFGDAPIKSSQVKNNRNFTQGLVDKCVSEMPERIKTYLNGRGIGDEIISKYKIGFGNFYGSQWITIPVKNFGEPEYTHFILRKDPDNKNEELAKNLSFPSGKGKVSLFGEYASSDENLVITEGIMDCLSLLSQGVKALFSTGGAMAFHENWIDENLLKTKNIYVAYDRDEAGEKGSAKVLKLLKDAGHKNLFKVVLPETVGDKGDVNDYLAKHKLPVEDLFNKYAEIYPKQIDTSQFNEMDIDELNDILGLTIIGDRVNKIITFLCQLSAFTENSQFNVIFNSPSSTGKSYTAIEVSMYFPIEDVLSLGSCSPTAFFHDGGKYDKETNTITVDLSNKVLIFKENQHYKLLEMLRSFLSHDEKITIIKITDKNQQGGNKTKNIKLIGYSSVVFCTAFSRSDEQEKTRAITLSPEITDEKIKGGINKVVKKESGASKYKNDLESVPQRIALKKRILAIRDAEIKNIFIADDDSKYLEEKFLKSIEIFQPRHQRDIQRVICLVKSLALLNIWHRNYDGENITAKRSDIDSAFELYEPIAITQNLGISPYLYQVFNEVIRPCYMEKAKGDFGVDFRGITYQEVMNYNHKVCKKKLNYTNLRQQVIPELEACGLVEKEYSEVGSRKVLIHVVDKSETELKEEIVGKPVESTSEEMSGVKPLNF